MASRLMHYIIGSQVAERIQLQNPDRFLFGNMLPDCVDGPGGRSGPKARSHFWDWREETQEKGQNWNWFWDKYGTFCEDELYLGYFCHLVADAVWGIDVYMPMKQQYGDRLKTVGTLYKDYHRMNELLRVRYAPREPALSWIENGIKEAELSFGDEYVQELLEDFHEDTGARKEDLEIMDYDRIVSFIEHAVSVCAEEVEARRDGRPGREPQEFYRSSKK